MNTTNTENTSAPSPSDSALSHPPGEQADGGYIFEINERGREEMAVARQQVPPLTVTLPADRWQRLPRTMSRLSEGGTLRIVMLGDSIINDTARSAWHELVKRHYPQADIIRIVCVRNATGCPWYKLDNRIDHYVVQQMPHLVMIGGISHQHDVDAIRECIRQIKASLPLAEFMLMTGPYGPNVDPLRGEDWRQRVRDGKDEMYAQELNALANEAGADYFDLQLAWGEFLRQMDKPVEFYMRDKVHANAIGEAVLGRIMEQYFSPQS